MNKKRGPDNELIKSLIAAIGAVLQTNSDKSVWNWLVCVGNGTLHSWKGAFVLITELRPYHRHVIENNH